MRIIQRRRFVAAVALMATVPLVAAGTAYAATVPVSIVNDNAFSPFKAKAQLGDTVTWTNNSMRQHNVTSDLGLFRSPRLTEDNTPGSHIQPFGSYSFTVPSAGKYPYRCTLDGFTGMLVVPLQASPASGSTATVFTITWATSVPSGYVEDIQLKKPGTSVFKDWRVGQTGASATFTPANGAGTYSFQARLRNVATGLTSSYTAAKVITVS